MVAETVFKKVDNLDKRFNELQESITSHLTQLMTTIKMLREPMREEPRVDAHIEGESTHHIHFHGDP